jgi:hypothetical protein
MNPRCQPEDGLAARGRLGEAGTKPIGADIRNGDTD